MNVRFFGGTKEQYLSLATPRNPLGLYFCADTRELFWGDKLLTDGTRIVATEADLPNLVQAADGITYFVEATRNGYVISPDRAKWIQVIRAPEGGNSVKAISFAGIEMEEADGVFTIDRRCAREALGFIVPDGLEDEEIVIATEDFVKDEIAKIDISKVNLDNYYTKLETDEAIANAVENIPQANLSNYATKQDVSDAISTLNPTVEEVKTKLEEEVLPIIPTVQETIIPTVQKVETEVIPTVQELAKKAATQDWVNEQGYLTEHQPLDDYAKKSDIPDTSDFITMQDVEDKNYLTEVPIGYATEEFVSKKIAEAELADQDVDLSAYYTKSETEGAIKAAVDAIDIPDVASLATKDELAQVEAKIPTDYLKEIPSDYITETKLNEAISGIKIPEAELYKVDFNAPDFAAAVEAYNNGKLLLLVNAAPDANGYAIMNYVRADLITFTKFLTSRSEAYGSFNTYYLHSDNTWEISKEVKLNKVEANVADEPTTELTSLRVGKEVYKLPDLANYVTNEILEQNYITQEEIANTYVTENYVVNNYVTQEAANNTYVTTEQVTEVVTNEVNTVVTEQIETKVETVIQEKVDTGEIKVNSISYGEF